MARATQPRGKLVRRFGSNIFENDKYDRLLERHAQPPGQHGERQQRRKRSDYALQLQEKQKLKYSYGLLEKQFRRTFQRANQQRGVTGDNLLMLLESRFDNAVFRAGFALTRMQARQMVNHGHFRVNDRRVDVPSYQLKAGDQVTIRDHVRSRTLVATQMAQRPGVLIPGWLQVDPDQQGFTVVHAPRRDEIRCDVNERLIIELYSK